jgi:hypothetical protein
MQYRVVVYLVAGLLSACSPKLGYLQQEVTTTDVSGRWQLSADSLSKLDAERNITGVDGEYSLVLSPSGECAFSSYGAAAREIVRDAGTWRIEKDAVVENEKIPNSLSISFTRRKTVERLFVGGTKSDVVLWCYADNGWGDRFAIYYARKRP